LWPSLVAPLKATGQKSRQKIRHPRNVRILPPSRNLH
jgi:hypothetical protein